MEIVMRITSSAARQTLMFGAGTFVPTIALACWAHACGTPGAIAAVTPLAMLTPALSAIVVQRLSSGRHILRGQPFELRLGRARWLLLAPAAFVMAIVTSILISFLLTPGLLVDHVGFAVAASHLGGVPGGAMEPASRFGLAIAMSLLLGPILNIPLFLGEELGWRGFMNPRLLEMFGRPGLLIGGAIWAVWHVPMILLGLNYPQHAFFGLLLWIPLCMGINVLLHEIKRRAGSILPCALAHGAMNQLAPLLMTVLFVRGAFSDLVDGPAGLAGLLVALVPAALVYRRMPGHPQSGLDSDSSSAGSAPGRVPAYS
jgi:uncharacterized protein